MSLTTAPFTVLVEAVIHITLFVATPVDALFYLKTHATHNPQSLYDAPPSEPPRRKSYYRRDSDDSSLDGVLSGSGDEIVEAVIPSYKSPGHRYTSIILSRLG